MPLDLKMKENSKNYISQKCSRCISSNTVSVIKSIKMQCLDRGYKGALEVLIQVESHFSVFVLLVQQYEHDTGKILRPNEQLWLL
jgi:hypothetical protein